MRVALFLPLLLAAATAAAQDSVLIEFEKPGEHLVFASSQAPTAEPEDGTLTKQDSLQIPKPSASATIYVLNRETGKIAVHPAKNLEAWKLREADYKDVASFTVKVEPARAVRIVLKDARRSSAILAEDGTANFFFVKPGRAEATIEFNQDGKPNTITQLVNVAPNGSETIALPSVGSEPPAVAEDKTAPTAQGQKSEPQSPSGGAGNVFAYLVGLAVVGGLGYVALRYYQQNKGQMDEQLEKLGVQVPKPQDAPLATADPAPAIPKAPEPPQKIMLDDAAPTPLAVGTPAATAIAMPTAGGGIWLAQGADRVDIPPGETVVGREPGLGLSLVGETSVSRNHATLSRVGDTVTLVDNGSTNGTFVNGAKVTSPTILRPGDEVQFGQAAFRFGG